MTFRVRAFLTEIHGISFDRSSIYEAVKRMDSRGVFDAMTRNVSALHGLRSTRAGYELALAVYAKPCASTPRCDE